MTSDAAKQQGVERQVIDHWIPEAPEDGWIEGVGVLIPFSDLRPETQALPLSVVQLPAVEGCEGFSVRCFLQDRGAIGLRFPPGVPVAVIDRCTGGRLYVLATPATLAQRQYDAFDAFREQARAARSDSLTYPTDRFVGVVKMRRQRVLVDLTLAGH